MPGRSIPPEIMAYLGPCRKLETVAEKVVEQCGFGKLMNDAGLTDYDPLVVVMCLVTEETLAICRSFKKSKARKSWCEAMEMIQKGEAFLEHNRFFPCRNCDQSFQPAIDEDLLKLFLAWYESRRLQDLLAIHRCPACGGKLKALQTRKYDGDMHTPEPASVEGDAEWAELLLQHSWL